MKITETSVKRPVTISMIFMAIMTISIVALSKLSIDLLPDVTFPTITVITTNTGVGPQEMESTITQPIEASLGSVSNVKTMKSNSVEGVSIVSIEFEWGTNMSEAASDIREKLDLIRDILPENADSPITFKFDMSMIPVYIFTIGGVSLDKARDFAEDVLKGELEQIDGVSSARNEGGQKKIIQINVNRNRLRAFKIPFTKLVQTLRAENINQPAGNLQIGYEDFTIRTEGEYKTLDEIRKVVVGVQGKYKKKPIYLENIAEVKEGFEDKKEIHIISQSSAVMVICQKQSGSNTVEVVQKILAKKKQIESRLPKGMYFKEIFNSADHIERSIGNLGSSAVFAGILAVLVVLFFLGDVRTTFIIAISIPTSIIVTFLLMYLANVTLNMMSFGGLALGVGMLVDNSIVVLENIYRHRSMGENKINAAIKGAKEVSMPITASTITTICVFLPLLFMSGISGEFFKEMALTVTFSLLGSLMVALTLIPMLSSKLIKIVDKSKRIKKKNKSSTPAPIVLKPFQWIKKGFLFIYWFFQKYLNLFRVVQKTFTRVEHFYRKAVRWALLHRKTIILGTLILFLGTCTTLSPLMQKEFMPESNRDTIFVDVELKEGTRLEVTENLAYHIAAKVESIPGVVSFSAKMGTGRNFFSIMQGRTGSHLIVGRINLVKGEKRSRSEAEIRQKIREILDKIPGVKYNFFIPRMTGSQDAPVQIEVRGKDLDASTETAKQIADIMKRDFSTSLRDIQISRKEGLEELVVKINRVKASTLGLNVSQIATTIRDNFLGIAASQYRMKGDELDIVARLKEKQRLTQKDLKNVIIASPLGFQVTLDQVAKIKRGTSPMKIERKGQERVIYVKANNNPGEGVGNIVDRLKNKVDNEIVRPEGINIIYGGSYKDMNEAFGDLRDAFLLAVLLIYMVMASQFESFLNPFIIIFSIPLSLVGVIWIILLTATKANVISGIGIIILAGVVVNNGIVLIDYIRQLRSEHGYELFEAIQEAGATRLRPILMTTLTTVIGMLPLAFGTGPGSEIRSPLAIAIVGGLTVSSVFTLIFIPVIYSMFQTAIIKRRKRKLNKLKEKGV